MRVISKGNKERLVPLPEAFGQVFGFWLKNQPRGERVFARAAGQKPVSAQAVRAGRSASWPVPRARSAGDAVIPPLFF